MLSFLKRTTKTRLLFFLVADIFFIICSIFLAFLLRFDGEIPGQYFEGVLPGMIVLTLVFCLPIFYFLKLYSFSWSYVSTNELISLAKAITLSFLFLGASLFILRDQPIFQGFPRSTLIIGYFLIFIFCGGIRLAKRIYLELFKGKRVESKKERTLIVGAGDAGEQILRSILASKNSSYLPIGFVDDNSTKQGIIIHGIKVLGKINDIPRVIQEKQIEQMIVALPSAGSQTIKKAVESSRKSGLKNIKVIPSITEIINEEVSIRDLREIQVEDLLGREPVKLNVKAIENLIKNKNVLITGAAGSIGSELSKQVAKFKPSLLLLLDQDETGIFNISEELKSGFPYLKIISQIADIRDKAKIDGVFAMLQSGIVFHAAAYKHVPLMEKQPDEALKNNIFGTEIVASASLKHNIEKFVFISTDKAVNPSSVMGATKRAGEIICQTLNQKNSTKFISVRFGNVLDSRGSVIPIFREQIKKSGPVEVTHPDMKRYFMTISEACLLVMQAAGIGKGGEVFVLDMGEPIKILDLAKEMIRLYGFEPDKDIPIVFTGVRPGEKLFEEVLTAEEGTIATQHQKIFMAKLSPIDKRKIEENLEKLKEAVKKSGRKEIINILKELILSYKPNYN
ncbi:polysaccharide biosynthesis protein [Patescibacteria group bacterium]|nr:polysaccharide biosynthesis protein [Patescibacteria group bacterium]